jgi:hypothetical protein
MVMERDCVAVCGVGWVVSAVWTVKVKLPAELGVPLIFPFARSVRPEGRVPEARVHVYPGVPPVAVRLAE